MLRVEMQRRAEGAPPRDLDQYKAWRADAMHENVELLDFYGDYLVNQYAGMTEALSLEAVRAALDIEGVPREDWPDMTVRLLGLHSLVMLTVPRAK